MVWVKGGRGTIFDGHTIPDFNICLRGFFSNIYTGDGPWGLCIEGRYAYITTFSYVISVDCIDPDNPIMADFLDLSGYSVALGEVKKYGDNLYILDTSGDGLFVVDTTNPIVLGLLGYIQHGDLNNPVDIDFVHNGATIYAVVVASNDNALVTLDVTDPSAITIENVFIDGYFSSASAIHIYFNYAYVTSPSADRLTIVNATSPHTMTAAQITGTLTDATNLNGARDVLVDGTRAFVSTTADIFTVVDVTTHGSMSVLGTETLPTISRTARMSKWGEYIFLTDDVFTGDMFVIDISTATAPELVFTKNVGTAIQIIPQNDMLYIATLGGSFAIYSIHCGYFSLPEPVVLFDTRTHAGGTSEDLVNQGTLGSVWDLGLRNYGTSPVVYYARKTFNWFTTGTVPASGYTSPANYDELLGGAPSIKPLMHVTILNPSYVYNNSDLFTEVELLASNSGYAADGIDFAHSFFPHDGWKWWEIDLWDSADLYTLNTVEDALEPITGTVFDMAGCMMGTAIDAVKGKISGWFYAATEDILYWQEVNFGRFSADYVELPTNGFDFFDTGWYLRTLAAIQSEEATHDTVQRFFGYVGDTINLTSAGTYWDTIAITGIWRPTRMPGPKDVMALYNSYIP